jgi:hypothetical protein
LLPFFLTLLAAGCSSEPLVIADHAYVQMMGEAAGRTAESSNAGGASADELEDALGQAGLGVRVRTVDATDKPVEAIRTILGEYRGRRVLFSPLFAEEARLIAAESAELQVALVGVGPHFSVPQDMPENMRIVRFELRQALEELAELLAGQADAAVSSDGEARVALFYVMGGGIVGPEESEVALLQERTEQLASEVEWETVRFAEAPTRDELRRRVQTATESPTVVLISFMGPLNRYVVEQAAPGEIPVVTAHAKPFGAARKAVLSSLEYDQTRAVERALEALDSSAGGNGGQSVRARVISVSADLWRKPLNSQRKSADKHK